jgi:hypothetical protein
LLLLLALAACKKSEPPQGASSAAVAAAPASAAPSAATAPKAWYEGRWSGTYEAALERIELEVGGVRAWKDDDGQRASGKGTLTVAVNPEGIATGEAEGPLGAQVVHGIADDGGLRLTLSPKGGEAEGFRGTMVLAKAPDHVAGSLNASSGDSLTVRKAKVELRPTRITSRS